MSNMARQTKDRGSVKEKRNTAVAGPRLGPEVMLLPECEICFTDGETYDYKQMRFKPQLSMAESKLLDLEDFEGGFFIWMSSGVQGSVF